MLAIVKSVSMDIHIGRNSSFIWGERVKIKSQSLWTYQEKKTLEMKPGFKLNFDSSLNSYKVDS